MVQCRDVKIGRAGAKAVYLIAASFCDQFSRSEKARALLDEHGEAVCWPSLDTLRNAAEMGRSKFLMEWRYLRDGGFVGTMYGNGTKVIRTPAAALRARAAGIAPRPRPTKGVGRATPSKVLDAQHLTVPREDRTYSSGRVAREPQSEGQPATGTVRSTDTIPDPAATPSVQRLEALRPVGAAEGQPQGSGTAEKEEVLALPPLSEDEHLAVDSPDYHAAARHSETALLPLPAAAPAGCPHCGDKGADGMTCRRCGSSLVSYEQVFRVSADFNAGGD